MLGATKPSESAPGLIFLLVIINIIIIMNISNTIMFIKGTIRGDFAVDVGRNICHGSDAVESAEKEIALWFPEGVNDWTSHSKPWIYERI